MMEKTLIRLLVLMIFSLHAFSQPPGTVELYKNFYVDETEVTNQHWKDYQTWTLNHLGDTSEEYKLTIVKQDVWKETLNRPFEKEYYKNIAFRDYPVVGISYEQAIAYCKWRTDRVNEYIHIQSSKELRKNYDSDSIYKAPIVYTYRLPSKEEFIRYSVPSYTKKNKKARKKQDIKLGNFGAKEGYTTAPVISYFPNIFGIYNSLGNVNELINEKGIALGGSYLTKSIDLNKIEQIEYDKPSSTIGFRCVAEKINK